METNNERTKQRGGMPEKLPSAEIPLKTLKLAVEQSFDGINITDLQGRILYANPASESMYGYGRGEMVGSSVLNLSSEEGVSSLEILKIVQAQEKWSGTRRQQRKDGSVFTAHLSVSLVAEDGMVLGMLGIVRDISDFERALRERDEYHHSLRKRNRFIETILDNLPIGLAVNYIDQGSATYMNKKFEEIYGWPREELRDIDQFFEKVYPDPVYRKQVRDMVMADIESGEIERMKWEGIHITCRDRSTKTISAANIPIAEQNSMISIVQDITESTVLQQQLLQAQKMESIGTLAGGIAHDFNNILTSILGFTELARQGLSEGRDVSEELENVNDAGVRAEELVKQILAFARQSEQEVNPVKLSRVVRDTGKFIRSSTPTSIEIHQNIDCDGVIMANEAQLYQVMMNLLTNAIQAMEDSGGRLEITLSESVINEGDGWRGREVHPGKYVGIQVTDTGTGIAPEHIDTIFEPYFTTKKLGEGTGLGLAMVHGIVESCNGLIDVESTLGRGTTFSLLFRKMDLPVEPRQEWVEEKPLGGGERLLFVDDEVSIAKLAEKSLAGLGYDVTAVTSSIEALSLVRVDPGRFDLVITDMTMPKMTGEELAKNILKVAPEMPVILCTGFSKKVSKEKALQLGIRAFLTKPVAQARLAATIREVLSGGERDL